MKNVFAIFAIAGLIATASCGGKTEDTAKADSLAAAAKADSLAQVEAAAAAAAQVTADSVAKAQAYADSVAAASTKKAK